MGMTTFSMIDTVRPLVDALETLTGRRYADNPRPFRIVADHLRAATFAIADGARPSNVEAGYIARRLIRRRFAMATNWASRATSVLVYPKWS